MMDYIGRGDATPDRCVYVLWHPIWNAVSYQQQQQQQQYECTSIPISIAIAVLGKKYETTPVPSQRE